MVSETNAITQSTPMSRKITTLDHYPGNKGSSAAYPTIINHIPDHVAYYELCAGAAEIYNKLYPAGSTAPYAYLNDLNPITYELLLATYPEAETSNMNAIEYLEALSLCGPIHLKGAFVYLDPPYVLSSRRSGAVLYQQEMSDDDHVQLLSTSLECSCNIMISGYDNEIYNDMLGDWNRVEFQVMTRKGVATEVLWMNYDIEQLKLHRYDYIGHGRTDRQRIKRKQLRMITKIKTMPKRERDYNR